MNIRYVCLFQQCYLEALLYYLMSSLTVGWLGSDSETFWAVFRASWSKPLCRHNTRYIFRPNWSSSSLAVRVIFGFKICENSWNFRILFPKKYAVNTLIDGISLYFNVCINQSSEENYWFNITAHFFSMYNCTRK